MRGAPAIAIVGSLIIASELKKMSLNEPPSKIVEFVKNSFDYLITARPTAVNITEAANRFKKEAERYLASKLCPNLMIDTLYTNLVKMLEDDITKNHKMADYGANHIIDKCQIKGKHYQILTHCNTGSLATGGYGTALGVLRKLHELGVLEHAYCTETRPYNQGSRLTAFELVHDNIPSTLICDSMAAFLMQKRRLSAVVVGADRIASNGDTANKIGTYQLAVTAKHHNVLFYVTAPVSTIDFSINNGNEIVIEERKKEEMINFAGKRIAPEEINCWNPAFDITPSDLITGGIITEYGVYKPDALKQLL